MSRRARPSLLGRRICGAPTKRGGVCQTTIPFAPELGPECIKHSPVASGAAAAAVRAGGRGAAARHHQVMPPGSADPAWDSPAAIRAWAREMAGRVQRGEQDRRTVAVELARLALATFEVEELHALREALLRVEHGPAVALILARLRALGPEDSRPLPWKVTRAVPAAPAPEAEP